MDEEIRPKNDRIYSPAFSQDELALMERLAGIGLEDEISAVRIAVRRTLQKLKGELEPAEFALMLNLVFRGANTVGSLVKVQRLIDGSSADSMIGSVAQILLEVRDEMGWEI